MRKKIYPSLASPFQSFFSPKNGIVTLLKSIGESAFEKNENLTSINIPNGIETIENRAFVGCNNLTEIVHYN